MHCYSTSFFQQISYTQISYYIKPLILTILLLLKQKHWMLIKQNINTLFLSIHFIHLFIWWAILSSLRTIRNLFSGNFVDEYTLVHLLLVCKIFSFFKIYNLLFHYLHYLHTDYCLHLYCCYHNVLTICAIWPSSGVCQSW